MVDEQKLREDLAKTCALLQREGLAPGITGNISARLPGEEFCLIKPSGFCLGDLKPEDFLLVDINTRKLIEGDGKPSIETPFHTTIYEVRKDAGSIVHVHAHYATVLSILDIPVESYTTDIWEAPKLCKGIAIAPYASPGTEDLARNLGDALRNCDAALMPHHGITTIGDTPETASRNAIVIERIAKIQYHAMLLGKPKKMPDS